MEHLRISHYELRRLLGRGGMGEVYEAFDLKAKRAVALKFVAPELASDPAVFKRFETEAVSAAAMNHPNIATLYEFEPDGPRPFIAMELVAGQSLRARIAAGPLDLHEALEVARDVAAALAYAHRRNIVPRDIKPENLMFDEDHRIKVMDFGLARALLASRLTMTGSSLGTPSYMSPESVQQGSGGPPSDVFALGLVLAEMLTGRQVFQAESPLSVMFAIANVEAPPLRAHRSDAPEAVEQLVQRMLHKDPEQRPDAAAVARELAEMTGMRVSRLALPAEPQTPNAGAAPGGSASAHVTSAPTLAMRPVPAPAAEAPVPAPAQAPLAPRRAGRGRPLLGIAAAAVVIAGSVAGVLWRKRSTAERTVRLQEAVVLNNQAYDAWRRGDLADARTKVALAVERDPSYGEALLNRAMILQSAGSIDSAAVLFRALLRSHGKDHRLVAMAYFNLGDIALNSDAPDQAVENLTRSMASDSSGWEVYNNLGFALTQAGRPAEALARLQLGAARFPGAAALYKNAAFALMALDRNAEAMAEIDRALARDASSASARGLRARLRARTGDRAGALTDWGLYVASEPPPDPKAREEVARDLREHGVTVEDEAGRP